MSRVVVAIFVIAHGVSAEASPPSTDNRTEGVDSQSGKRGRAFRATRTKDLIEVVPLGVSFRIPQRWLDWDKGFHNNLHLTEEELAAVKTGDDADWDPEYAIVVNAVLPFERCAIHAGAEGWGRRGVSYGDLQMRVYVLDQVPEKTEAKVISVGVQAVRTLFTPRRVAWRARGGPVTDRPPKLPKNPDQPPRDMKMPVTRSSQDQWRQVAVSYDLDYGDYGAKASVDFRIRRMRGRTVAVVFMYTDFDDQAPAIKAILGSFAAPDDKSATEAVIQTLMTGVAEADSPVRARCKDALDKLSRLALPLPETVCRSVDRATYERLRRMKLICTEVIWGGKVYFEVEEWEEIFQTDGATGMAYSTQWYRAPSGRR